MKHFVLILRKVAKFVFRLISSRLSSDRPGGTINPEELFFTKRRYICALSMDAIDSATVAFPEAQITVCHNSYLFS